MKFCLRAAFTASIEEIRWSDKVKDVIQRSLFNKGFDRKELLNKEHRREIAYTGIITHQLTRNYHRLVHDYGGQEVLKDYYQEILQFQREAWRSASSTALQTQVERKREEPRIGYLKKPREGIIPIPFVPEEEVPVHRLPSPLLSPSSLPSDLPNFKLKVQKLQQLLDQLNTDKLDWTHLAEKTYLSVTPQRFDFSDPYTIPSFYRILTEEPIKPPGLPPFPYPPNEFRKLSRYDHLLIFNFSKAKTYQK